MLMNLVYGGSVLRLALSEPGRAVRARMETFAVVSALDWYLEML
jgi:hypothetical protein